MKLSDKDVQAIDYILTKLKDYPRSTINLGNEPLREINKLVGEDDYFNRHSERIFLFLQQKGLVSLSYSGSSLQVIKLFPKGHDVAEDGILSLLKSEEIESKRQKQREDLEIEVMQNTIAESKRAYRLAKISNIIAITSAIITALIGIVTLIYQSK